MTPDDFRAAAHAAADLVSDYLDGLPARPVWQPMDGTARAALLDAPSRPGAPRSPSCSPPSSGTSCRTRWATATRVSSAG
ncbi:hypothetical protein ACFQ0M_39210 [Kitasatospora aburaviensis]